jgi:hypothetical protein
MKRQRPITAPSFQDLFCKRFACTPSQYQERVFRACLYRHARVIAPLLRPIKNRFFATDLKFIRYLGECTDLDEAVRCAADFQDANLGKRSSLRMRFRIRLSGRKAIALARRTFPTPAPQHRA